MKKILLFLGLAGFMYESKAQVTFQTVYGTAFVEQAHVIETTLNGGYAMAGNTTAHDSNGNYLLIVTNPNGDTVFTREFDQGIDYLADMKCTSDSGYILCGSSRDSANPFSRNVLLIKTNSLGIVQWAMSYGFNGTESEYPSEIIQSADGGFAVVGRVSANMNEGFLLKVDAAGTLQWLNRYAVGAPASDLCCLMESQGGGFIAAGNGYSPVHSSVFVLKVDNAGSQIWCHKFNASSLYQPNSVLEHGTGNIYICGGKSIDSANARGFIMKLNAGGYLQWTKVYDLNQQECAFERMILTVTGELAITGRRSWPSRDGFVLTADLTGATSFGYQYIQSNSREYLDLVQGADGGFAILSHIDTLMYPVANGVFLLVKTTSTLTAACGMNAFTINDSAVVLTDSLKTLAVQSGNNNYAAGVTIYGGLNVTPVCALVGMEEERVEVLNVYPNPATDVLTIESEFTGAELIIYGANGAVVLREQLMQRQHTITLGKLSPGLYFYQVQGEDGIVATGKIVKE
jgi:hypothetical protein